MDQGSRGPQEQQGRDQAQGLPGQVPERQMDRLPLEQLVLERQTDQVPPEQRGQLRAALVRRQLVQQGQVRREQPEQLVHRP
jgi:hypothetical protein